MIAFCTDEEKDHPGLLPFRLVLVENSTNLVLIRRKFAGISVKHTLRYHSVDTGYWNEPSFRGVRDQKTLNDNITHQSRVSSKISGDPHLFSVCDVSALICSCNKETHLATISKSFL